MEARVEDATEQARAWVAAEQCRQMVEAYVRVDKIKRERKKLKSSLPLQWAEERKQEKETRDACAAPSSGVSFVSFLVPNPQPPPTWTLIPYEEVRTKDSEATW
ncbi:hypothetical protein JDV02_009085 [Purpureocillium takamizusanense]|uniref:Uncharacterized protein n=1 Tax=Purpureocillium takamizusanense TaxID=2060973 RepID=A0A9Q8VF39_9HYPO|nr:uncharacterized protein JDV02_009085 [Purpureocillium takamizusanense]UNI23253.1 hypothetical protein JDV02_009085 [Purpureocillium takamizusanense]